MKNLQIRLTIFATFFVLISLIINFTGCASSKVGDNSDSSSFDLTYNSNPDYDKFTQMLMAGTFTEEDIEAHLKQWASNAPLDPDLYKSNFMFYYNQSFLPADIELVKLIPEGKPNVILKDRSSGDRILVSKDFCFSLDSFEVALAYLENGLELYPNRIDLWDNLLLAYSELYLLDNSTKYSIEFLDNFVNLNKKNVNWYKQHNQKIEFSDEAEKNELFINMILNKINKWITNYPLDSDISDASYKILTKLQKVFPNNYRIYNEMGLALMYEKTPKAIKNFEKAYILSPGNLEISFNLVLCSLLTGDEERFNKYSDVIYNSGDIQFINYFQKNIDMIFNEINKM